MSFHNVICPKCFATEERYFQRSTDPHCSYCGAFLTGQAPLTAEEFYEQFHPERRSV